jgi:hypothetical protein
MINNKFTKLFEWTNVEFFGKAWDEKWFKYKDDNWIEHLIVGWKEIASGTFVKLYENGDFAYQKFDIETNDEWNNYFVYGNMVLNRDWQEVAEAYMVYSHMNGDISLSTKQGKVERYRLNKQDQEIYDNKVNNYLWGNFFQDTQSELVDVDTSM